jgi:hypothetical protein
MWQDKVNAAFEVGGSLFILLSIRRLHRDKVVKGVSWIQVAYFMVFGLWNIYYYPSIDQFWSFIGGIGVVIANMIWLCQCLYYYSMLKIHRYLFIEE